MKIADILRTLANNLDHAQGGAPDPRIQNPGQMIDVAVVDAEQQANPNGTTASGNEKDPKGLFMPPLQQKQELLKKAVGVENVYDDGNPEHQHEEEISQEIEGQSSDDSIERIKQLSGIPVVAIAGLSDDEPLES